MANANDIQVDGNHYKVKPYQHWDFALDTKMPYLLGCATKYPSRWLDKNGIKDLEKSIHYLQKAKEHGVFMPTHDVILLNRFCSQLRSLDAKVVWMIYYGDYDEAIIQMQDMIDDYEFGAGSSYTNQDPTWFKG